MVLVAEWYDNSSRNRLRAKTNYRVRGDPWGRALGASEFARLDQSHPAFSSLAETGSQMNLLLLVVQLLLGVFRHDNARLEPILARSDGRTCAPSRRVPMVWVPGWGWMISLASILHGEARQRPTDAPPAGALPRGTDVRENRPPDVWRDR
jgi:hypothetical protein